MAEVTGNQIVTTGTGASDYISLAAGKDYRMQVQWAGIAGDMDLQAGDGTDFADVLDKVGGSVVNITSEVSFVVRGGTCYQFDVTTHTSAATITFHEV